MSKFRNEYLVKNNDIGLLIPEMLFCCRHDSNSALYEVRVKGHVGKNPIVSRSNDNNIFVTLRCDGLETKIGDVLFVQIRGGRVFCHKKEDSNESKIGRGALNPEMYFTDELLDVYGIPYEKNQLEKVSNKKKPRKKNIDAW